MNTQDRDRAWAYAEAFYAAAFERWLAALTEAADRLAREPGLLGRGPADLAEFATRKEQLDRLLPADVDLPVRNLLYTLAQRGDLGLLREVVLSLQARVKRGKEAAVRAVVTSAVPLTPEEQAALAQKLTAQYGADLEFEFVVDPAILGGLIVRVGDRLIDGSVASKLAALKQALGVTVPE